MDRRAGAVFQSIRHSPLHNHGHALPVQPVFACCTLPTQFPRHSHPTTKTTRHAAEIPAPWPFPHGRSRHSRSFRMSCTSLHRFRHHPTAHQPLAQPVDGDDHLLTGFFHPGDRMGFQFQLFPDRCFYENLEPTPSLLGFDTTITSSARNALSPSASPQLQVALSLMPQLHFSERNRKTARLPTHLLSLRKTRCRLSLVPSCSHSSSKRSA